MSNHIRWRRLHDRTAAVFTDDLDYRTADQKFIADDYFMADSVA